MKWLLLGLFVGCTPSCAFMEAVGAWFSTPSTGDALLDAAEDVASGNFVGAAITIGTLLLGGTAYGWRRARKAKRLLNGIEAASAHG